jgi:hypothetical protein
MSTAVHVDPEDLLPVLERVRRGRGRGGGGEGGIYIKSAHLKESPDAHCHGTEVEGIIATKEMHTASSVYSEDERDQKPCGEERVDPQSNPTL